MPAEPDKPQQRKNSPGGVLVLVAIALVVLICAGVLIKNAVTGSNSDDQSYSATVACEGFVKDRLKAPSTAKFSGESTSQDGSTWTVTGAVDAQNGFGAMLRSTFTCTLLDQGSAWHLQSLSMT